MRDASVPVLSWAAAAPGAAPVVVGSTTLPGAVWDVPLRVDLVHRVVHWQRSKRREGTYHTATRGDVSGTTRKHFRQKGMGRARVGDIRSPIWNRGGKAFGKRKRSFYFPLPRAIRRHGLKVALSAKLAEGRVLVVDEMGMDTHKTKAFKAKLGWLREQSPPYRGTFLLSDVASNAELPEGKLKPGSGDARVNLRIGSRLICGAGRKEVTDVGLLPSEGLNVYDILLRETLVVTPPALEALHERVLRPVRRPFNEGYAPRGSFKKEKYPGGKLPPKLRAPTASEKRRAEKNARLKAAGKTRKPWFWWRKHSH